MLDEELGQETRFTTEVTCLTGEGINFYNKLYFLAEKLYSGLNDIVLLR